MAVVSTRLVRQPDLAGHDVDGQVAEVEGHRSVVAGRWPDPAQHGADPGGQLGRGEGLHDVVVGAELEAEDPVGLPAPGGDQDDRDVARAADGGQDVEAVLGGEHDVEDDEVGLAGLMRLAMASAPVAASSTW